MKVVINACYGGFRLSHEAVAAYAEGTEEINSYSREPEFRSDPKLVAIVEELGERAAGRYSELKIVEVPDDVSWYIDEYDGMEWVAEDHRTWR
jgi:hypothetical protein